MDWIFQIHDTHPVAQAVAILAMVCAAGMALGSVRIAGAGLGTAGVLFAGIVTGHFAWPVDRNTLEFVKEFGLILFIFTIGLQLGPGFFAALRKQGVRLNALAALIVTMGAVSAPLIGKLAGLDSAAVLGIFSGASVNMPSLGASTQTLGTLPGVSEERLALPALACAVTFPAAILASIASLLILGRLLRIDPGREAAAFADRTRVTAAPLERRTLIVSNPNLDGLRLEQLPHLDQSGVTIARVCHDNLTEPARDTTVVRTGDRMTAVGTHAALDAFERLVGRSTDEDLVLADASIAYRRVVVTERSVLSRTIGELDLDAQFNVAVTRITRADIEMTAVPGLRLQFGDVVRIVGHEADLDRATAALGNSIRELNETHFIPLFIGILLGVVLGTMPIAFPGFPQPLRLGLAGGPLIVALIIGRFGRIGRLVSHMPLNANLAFREFGVALFFAGVGLEAGPRFFSTVFSDAGPRWLAVGLCVTTLPLLIGGFVGRAVLKLNYVDLSGLLAGATTNPPALTFANSISGSDGPTLAYATVYPLTMLLRILCAQFLALVLVR